ncbi:hypothetical protein J1614_010996 [Plenodomus biglobosus]|nr:hypothetical protein J1614_010996 [Plenodomus biglobosus]
MAINDHDFPPLPSQRRSLFTRRNNATSKRPMSSTMAATFNDLPDELILEIVDHLTLLALHKSRLSTLASLSRTSRRLHQIVAPRVFKYYHTSFCEPYIFLRTIITNPRLAELVQNVNILYGSSVRHNHVKHNTNAQDKKVIKEGIRALGLPDWKGWVAECNADDADLEALHAIMLLHTPNVVSLSVQNTDHRVHRILRWVEAIKTASPGKSQGRMHPFKYLRSIEVNMSYSSMLQVGPVFRLASLRRFVALELFEDDAQKDLEVTALQRVMPPRSNNIEELYLKEECFISTEKLAVVLASPRGLKTFLYDLSTTHFADEDEFEQKLGSDNLSGVLSCQKDTLESFQLTTHLRQANLPTTIRFYGLGEFQSLQNLHCPFMSVCRINSDTSTAFVQMFPSSLERLHLTIPPFSLGDSCELSIEYLAKHYSALAPALRELHVSPWSSHNWKQCESLCSEIGLSFKTDKPPMEDWASTWGTSRMHYASSSGSSGEVDLYSNDANDH